jgi:peptide/nickel transport system substrate-binding protein
VPRLGWEAMRRASVLLQRARSSLALALLSALGCASAEVPHDVLVVGQLAEPRALDPHVVTSLNDFRILASLCEGLVRFADGSLEIEPALAESWSVSEDGRVYRFALRRGVRFHDGTPLDAEAVRFNLERMLREDHPQHGTGPFPLAFFFEAVREVRTPDAHTVELVLSRPFAPLLANLAYPTGFLVSPQAVRTGGRGFRRAPVGTGPFRFVSWESRRAVVVERNPGHWEGAAPLRQVVFRPLVDPRTRVTELVAGDVDLLVEVSPDAVAQLDASPDFTVHRAVGPHLWFLILNTRHGPFGDHRLRLAANLAVDRRALVEHVLQGTASLAAGPVPSAFAWARNPALEPHPHDPERAAALVREAGHTDGVDVVFLAPQGGSGMLDPVVMATAIQADLGRVGIRAKIQTFEWNAYLARVNAGLGNADLAAMAWMTNDPDTLPYLALRSEAWPERGGFNSGYYAEPDVDRWIEAARRETDPDARAALYRRIAARVHEDAPWVVVASWNQSVVTRASVRGFRAQPSFLLDLRRVSKAP